MLALKCRRVLGGGLSGRKDLVESPGCTSHGECTVVCPKEIPLEFIGKMNQGLI